MDDPVYNPSESVREDSGAATLAEAGSAARQEAYPGPASGGGPAPAKAGASRPHAGHEGEHWLSTIQWICGTVVIAIFVITFLTQAFQIPSESMEDTLQVGDYLLVDKVHFASPGIWHHLLPYEPIRRGDIIVFRYPVNPTLHFVKRVVALPGDRLHLSHGQVYVNGSLVRDSGYAEHKTGQYDSYRDDFPGGDYISSDVNSTWWVQMHHLVEQKELVVPAGKYFVLGDNRDRSLDSRYWGFVPRENIIGRPLVIYWSMRQPDGTAGAADGKLARLAYMLTHFWQNARWGRSMRLIH